MKTDKEKDIERFRNAIFFLKEAGVIKTQADIAEALGYSRPQTISDYLKGKVAITARFVNTFLSHYGINRDWWEKYEGAFFAKATTPGVGDKTTANDTQPEQEKTTHDVPTDPSTPGIYQDIVRALIKASDELAESSKAQREISRALLEERQQLRQTVKVTQSSLDELRAQMALNFRHDEQVDLFLAERIAALEKRPVKQLLEDMFEKMSKPLSSGPIEQDMSMSPGTGTLSEA